MATKRVVPRATGEGGIGRTDKLMGPSYFSELGLSSKLRMYEATVSTANATPTVLWSKTIADNEVSFITALAVAGKADGVSAAGYFRTVLVRKPGTGAPVVVRSNTLGTDAETTLGMNLTWTISGNTLQLLATGIAAVTLAWRASVQVVTS